MPTLELKVERLEKLVGKKLEIKELYNCFYYSSEYSRFLD